MVREHLPPLDELVALYGSASDQRPLPAAEEDGDDIPGPAGPRTLDAVRVLMPEQQLSLCAGRHDRLAVLDAQLTCCVSAADGDEEQQGEGD